MKSLLAIWMVIVSLGVTISHAHASPDTLHVHGFGWNCPHCSQIRSPDEDEPAQPGQAHCHFILLGFELPAESAPPDGVAVQSVLAYESAGLVTDNDPTCDRLDSLDGQGEASFCSPDEAVVLSVLIPAPLLVASPLSLFGLRELAGVLRS